MSFFLILILIALIFWVVSQFGDKLNARSSLAWWLIFGFILFSTVYPAALLPIAQALGIQVVSNMVMAGLLVLLLFLSIQESALSTALQRKLRDSVTTQAAKEFVSGRAVCSSGDTSVKNILVIFPTFNEEASLPSLLDSLRQFRGDPAFYFTFLFVSDGSKDATDSILDEARNSHPQVDFVAHSTNVGVAGVMLTGFKVLSRLRYDFAVQCDADGQHPIDQIPALVKKAMELNADLTIGSRYLDQGAFEKHESSSLTRRIGSAILTSALRLFSFGVKISDPTSGFRVYSAEAVRCLANQMPDEYPEPESVGLLLLAKKKVIETEVTMRARLAGESSLGGIKGAQFMIKVVTALVGLRLRGLFKR